MAKDNILKVGSNEMELVDFRIFKQEEKGVYEGIYGVNVAKVREIIKIPNLTELPGVPDYIEGIFDLRGIVIPVVNLAKWMNIQEPDDGSIKPRIIITEFSDILIGFVVHEAKRIRRISWKDIEPASFVAGMGSLDKSQITGVTRIENDDVLLILDLESVVQALGIYQPKIDIHDSDIMKVDEGLERMGGSKELYQKLLKEFIRQLHEEVMPSLEKNLPSQNDTLEKWELFRATIHTLKGVTANLSLSALNQSATNVDAQIKQSQRSDQSTINALYLSIVQTEDAIYQWLKE